MLENVIETTEYCRHCLMCRHMAPVGNITHRETLTPHGLGQLVASERRGMIEWNEDTVDALFADADAGNCRAHCVTDQPLPEALAAVRAKLVDRDLAPEIVYDIKKKFQQWENPYDEQSPEPVEGTGKVALFVGDEARYLSPDALDAALELLQKAGIDPVLVGGGRNNGFIASSLGLSDVAENLAQANLADLEASGAEKLLVLSPGDYFAFSQMYEERLGIEWPEEIELQEVVSFLAEQAESGALEFQQEATDEPYAYIDPTHTVRVKERSEAPRALLAGALSGEKRELFWREERAYPCGNLGLAFTHPDIANGLTRERFEDAVKVGAKQVLTDCPGSLHHLNKHKDEYDVKVQGLYEFLVQQAA